MSGVSMQFCPTCANMLLLERSGEEEEYSHRYFCQTCAYVCGIGRPVVADTPLVKKEVDDVLGGSEAWINAQRTDTVTCEKCGNTGAFYFQLQTRSADEPMTTMYKCASMQCGRRWQTSE
eukprot:133930_1